MKKLFNLCLSLAVSALIAMPSFAYPDVTEAHWAFSQIQTLTEQGVIVGYPDGTFQPDENVTRAEFASMAIKALGQELSLIHI